MPSIINAILSPETLSNSLKLASGLHTTVTAADTIVIDLRRILAVVAVLEDAPVIGCDRAQAVLGDQAGRAGRGFDFVEDV